MVLDAFIQELIEPSNSSIHNDYCPTHYFPDEEMMALRNNLVKVTLISGTADSEASQMAEPCSGSYVQLSQFGQEWESLTYPI